MGPYPPLDQYDHFNVWSAAKRREMEEWHAAQTGTFNLREVCLQYCKNDVAMLREIMRRYMVESIDKNGINPLETKKKKKPVLFHSL